MPLIERSHTPLFQRAAQVLHPRQRCQSKPRVSTQSQPAKPSGKSEAPSNNGQALAAGLANGFAPKPDKPTTDTSVELQGGDGDTNFDVKTGGGNDDVTVLPGKGKNKASVDTGPGDDQVFYDGFDSDQGNNQASFQGGEGKDFLHIGSQNFTLKDSEGKVLHKEGEGQSQYVADGFERIAVNGQNLGAEAGQETGAGFGHSSPGLDQSKD
ncbi:MAG: hypothetical protein AB7S38_12645 [Vulcanimicrobiota bacterium]